MLFLFEIVSCHVITVTAVPVQLCPCNFQNFYSHLCICVSTTRDENYVILRARKPENNQFEESDGIQGTKRGSREKRGGHWCVLMFDLAFDLIFVLALTNYSS